MERVDDLRRGSGDASAASVAGAGAGVGVGVGASTLFECERLAGAATMAAEDDELDEAPSKMDEVDGGGG